MICLFIVLILMAIAPATSAEVVATRLDGDSIRGELQSWNEIEVLLTTTDGEQRLATRDLFSLELQSSLWSDSKGETPQAELELIDGTILPIEEYVFSDGAAAIQPAVLNFSSGDAPTIGRSQLAAVRLHRLSDEAAQQWLEIRDMEFAGDVLVLLKRNGKSLDYLEGVMGNVSSDKLEFKVEGETVRIDRSKVAGFLYLNRQKVTGEPPYVLKGQSGLQARVVSSHLEAGVIHFTTASGIKLSWPLSDVAIADYSAGKLLFLSDLDPASEEWTPLVGFPSSATLATAYGRPRRNHSAYGGPLSLEFIDPNSIATTSYTRTFSKGLAVRSRTELVYRIPNGYRRFTTFAGIDPSTNASGTVRLEIHGDEVLLLEGHIAGDEPPSTIELEIAGVKRLKIIVDYGDNLDSGDWLNLCDARIIK